MRVGASIIVTALIAMLLMYRGYFTFFAISSNKAVLKVKVEEGVDVSIDGRPGRESRPIGDVHRMGISHRGVWGFVFDETQSYILFVKRSKETFICPNSWNTVGEHSALGESYKDSMLRGLQEELGLSKEVGKDIIHIEDLGPAELLYVNHPSINRVNRQWTQTFYLVIRRNGDNRKQNRLRIDADETSDFTWVHRDSAIEWITYCEDKKLQIGCRTCTDGTNISLSSSVISSKENIFAKVLNFDSFASFIASKLLVAIEKSREVQVNLK